MSRKKVTVQARELSEMDISRISLVKRGANRVPFRIIKSHGDNTMLDLATIFFQKKEAPVAPAVIAIALAKGADIEAYTKALTDAGFEIDHVAESDDGSTLMLNKDEALPEDITAFKISEDCVLVIEGIQKGLMAWPDSNSFVENITKAGFAPSYRVANDILSETVSNIMFSDGDAVETKAAVSKALSDFQGYVEAVLSTVPVQAFKAEAAITAVEKGLLDEHPDKGGKAAKKAKPKKDKKDTKKSEGEDDSSDDAEGSETVGDADADATGDDVAAEKTSADDGAETTGDDDAEKGSNAELIKTLSGLTDVVGALKSSIGEVEEKLSERLDGLEAKVKKTDEALAGTVHSEDSEDNDSVSSKKADAQKTDGTVNWDSVLDFGEGVELS